MRSGKTHIPAAPETDQGERNAVSGAAKSAETPIVEALRALLAAPRILKIYPAGHQRVLGQLDEVTRLFATLFEGRSEPLILSASGIRIEVDGRVLTSAETLCSELALKLRRRRIGRITIRPGVGHREIGPLIELLGTDHRQILRAGGVASFMPQWDAAALSLESLARPEDRQRSPIARLDLPPHVADALEECLRAPECLDVIRRFRSAPNDEVDAKEGAEGSAPDGASPGGTLNRLLADFFSDAGWSVVSRERIRKAFETLLQRLEEATLGAAGDEDDSDSRRLASIRSLFHGLTPADLLAESEAEPQELEQSGVEYSTEGMLDLVEDRLEGSLETARASIRSELESHRPHLASLLILCDVMLSSMDRESYFRGRETFLSAIEDTHRYTTESVARILGYIAVDLPSPRFESRDDLVRAVFNRTADEEALVLFLGSMTDQPDVVRPILDRLLMRQDPFPLLARLLQAPMLGPFYYVLVKMLIETARTRQEAFVLWARRDRESFFAPQVFAPLFSLGTELLGGICREILTHGSLQERRMLIERLRGEESEVALRLLVMGVPYAGMPCYEELLDALGSFEHQLAVAALVEVIHRNNVERPRMKEADAALRSLGRIRLRGSRSFLREVAGRRCALLPLYRRPLRRAAEEILAAERCR